MFLNFQSRVEKYCNAIIKFFQCDGAPELTQGKLKDHFSNSGIQYRITCPHTPEQNGLSERKIRHLTEMGTTLLFNASMPKNIG